MYYKSPSLENVNVLFVYKNFKTIHPASHDGLGISSLLCVKVLRRQGVQADLLAVCNITEIEMRLRDRPGITHCVIQAPWIGLSDLANLLAAHPAVHFVVLCHSQIAFLQADNNAMKNIRDQMPYQDSVLNFTFAVNNKRLQDALVRIYGGRCLLLPNLYDITSVRPPIWRAPGVKDRLKIGSFGALRIQKNHSTAAFAACAIGKHLGADIDFHVSTGRDDGGGQILKLLRNVFAGLGWARLVEVPWLSWPAFRSKIAEMDLCIQLSMTESFNIISADAAHAYVPSVVSDTIDWTPTDWRAVADNSEDAARTGLYLLSNQDAGNDGRMALEGHMARALPLWLTYLESNPT